MLEKIKKILITKKYKISVVESCTGGLLASQLTKLSGSSKFFNLGLVTYSNNSKKSLLRIPNKLIKKYGAVSSKCCFQMVKNLNKISKSQVCISITGIAGPKGGSKQKPVGLVFIGIKVGKDIRVNKYQFKNKSRSYIQKSSVNKSLKLILNSFA